MLQNNVFRLLLCTTPISGTTDFIVNEVQVGKDQKKAQSEKDSHSKNRGGKKTKLTIKNLYHETYRKPNEQLTLCRVL